MQVLKALSLIITSTAVGLVWLAILTLFILSNGCSADVNIKDEHLPKPCANSNLVKDWLPTQEGHGTAFFRADCSFTVFDSAETTPINGTFKDLTPSRTKGEVLLTIRGVEYFYQYRMNNDRTVLQLFQ
jgi:hypothetical protein